eukprot:scaffold6638_cov76-Phaeocystis_antarctica.AAC.6
MSLALWTTAATHNPTGAALAVRTFVRLPARIPARRAAVVRQSTPRSAARAVRRPQARAAVAVAGRSSPRHSLERHPISTWAARQPLDVHQDRQLVLKNAGPRNAWLAPSWPLLPLSLSLSPLLALPTARAAKRRAKSSASLGRKLGLGQF